MYREEGGQRSYSLRSAKDGIDVSKIAAMFGGGGHYHAAGFAIKSGKVDLKSGSPRWFTYDEDSGESEHY